MPAPRFRKVFYHGSAAAILAAHKIGRWISFLKTTTPHLGFLVHEPGGSTAARQPPGTHGRELSCASLGAADVPRCFGEPVAQLRHCKLKEGPLHWRFR